MYITLVENFFFTFKNGFIYRDKSCVGTLHKLNVYNKFEANCCPGHVKLGLVRT